MASEADWIEWAGGPRPVQGDEKVEVKTRRGSVHCALAAYFGWAHLPLGHADDIIAYRVVQS